MLRNMLHEIIRRRLWPIPLVAVIVMIAAPVLLLKSAPAGAPLATASVPAPAAVGKLPARAQRLLAATAAASARSGAKGSERDPFLAPAGRRVTATTDAAAAAATPKPKSATSGAASGGGATTTAPIPVVIQNADGTSVTPTTGTTPSTGSASGAGAGSSGPASVDVRFGPSAGGRVHRAIPRLQTFYIHGKLAAVFVKYSPSRHKAVFAVSPDLIVTGPVKCRTLNGVCRYVDIPAGSYVRLTMLTSDRILVRRRLDVARISHGRGVSSTTAVAAGDHSENACLLGKLQALRPGGTPIDRVACER
ncbi:MAG TPA: hypothetical protein VL120_12900 [Solirubrobacteraceae bacterium]|jgi:hypothetical protein|nr:hypothetical protein [Solirubrobacteraceae bacterium]